MFKKVRLIFIAGVLVLILFLEAQGLDSFSDVPNENFYQPHIQKLLKSNVITGYVKNNAPTGQFGPNDPINRAAFTKLTVSTRITEEIGEGGVFSSGWEDYSRLEADKKVDGFLTDYYNCTDHPNNCRSIGGKEFLDTPGKAADCSSQLKENQNACEPWFGQYVYYAVNKGFIKGYENPNGGNGRVFKPSESILRIHALKMILADNGNIDGVTDGRFQRLYNLALSRNSYAPKCLKGAENIILKNNGGNDVFSRRLLDYALLADRLDFYGNECQFFTQYNKNTPKERANFLQEPMLRKEAARFFAIAMNYAPVNPDPNQDSTINTANQNSSTLAANKDYVAKNYEQALADGDLNPTSNNPNSPNNSNANNSKNSSTTEINVTETGKDGGKLALAGGVSGAGGGVGSVAGWKDTGSGHDSLTGQYKPISNGMAYRSKYGEFNVLYDFFKLHENKNNEQGLTQKNNNGEYDTGTWTPLGFPTSKYYKVTSPETGAVAHLQNFQGGIIYWSGKSGDGIKLMKAAAQSPQGTDGFYLPVATGILYKDHDTNSEYDAKSYENAYFVENKIKEKHEAEGGTRSKYGFPKNKAYLNSGVWRQDFEDGFIDGDRGDGNTSISELAQKIKLGRCCPNKGIYAECKQIEFSSYNIEENGPWHDGSEDFWHKVNAIDKKTNPNQCWVSMRDTRDGWWNNNLDKRFQLNKEYDAIGGYYEKSIFTGNLENKTTFMKFNLNIKNSQPYSSEKNANTYILIHGWKNSPDSWPNEMSELIRQHVDQSAQFVIIDWSDIVSTENDGGASPDYASTWIDSVASQTANALKKWGIKKEKTVIIGHSLGTLLGKTLDKKLGGVSQGIYLDPAQHFITKYNIDVNGNIFPGFENTGRCFVAEGSWAGSEKTLLSSCKERYIIDYDDLNNIIDQHNWTHGTYREMIRHPFYQNILSLKNKEPSYYQRASFTDWDFGTRTLDGIIYTPEEEFTNIKYLKTITKTDLDRYTLYGNSTSNEMECDESKECIIFSYHGKDKITQYPANKDIYLKDFEINEDKLILMKGLHNKTTFSIKFEQGTPIISLDYDRGIPYQPISSKVSLQSGGLNLSPDYSDAILWLEIAAFPENFTKADIETNPFEIDFGFF